MDSGKFQKQIKLNITQTKLSGVLLIKPPTIFEDFRGSYIELYNEEIYKKYWLISNKMTYLHRRKTF